MEDKKPEYKPKPKKVASLEEHPSNSQKYGHQTAHKDYPAGGEFIRETEAQRDEIPDLAAKLRKIVTEEIEQK